MVAAVISPDVARMLLTCPGRGESSADNIPFQDITKGGARAVS